MNFGEQIIELNNRLSITVTNTFWTPAMLESWLNQANRWACFYKHWPQTERARFTPSRANALFYDYPERFRTDSIRRLEIQQADGKMLKYTKKRYEDFMDYIQNNPAGTDRIFSDFRRQYFINPKVEVAGREICVWGQESPDVLTLDTDITPFTEGEEAIIKRALMIALQKAKKYREAAIERDEAKLILEQIWERSLEEQAQYQVKDTPFFRNTRFF